MLDAGQDPEPGDRKVPGDALQTSMLPDFPGANFPGLDALRERVGDEVGFSSRPRSPQSAFRFGHLWRESLIAHRCFLAEIDIALGKESFGFVSQVYRVPLVVFELKNACQNLASEFRPAIHKQ